MSTLKVNRQQLGQSSTATQNFTLTAEAADGTMKIARGNAGATTQDVLTVDSSGYLSGIVQAPQFDNSLKLASTAFVQRQGMQASGIVTVTTSSAIPASAAGSLVLFYSPSAITPTLPLLSSVPVGARFEFVNFNAGTATVTHSGSDSINVYSGAALPSVPVKSGDNLVLIAGSNWEAVSGTSTLIYSSAFNAGNGWQKMPSGLILQWITGTAGQNGTGVDNSFPISFPTAYLSIQAIHLGTDPSVNIVVDSTQPNTSTGVRLRSSYAGGNVTALIIALGY